MMFASVTKTKRDEEKWEKAQELASEAGKKDNWGYIMGIYKKMKPDYDFKNAVLITRSKHVAEAYLNKMAASKTATPSPDAIKVLKGLARGTKGVISLKGLAETLEPLGWQFRLGKSVQKLTGSHLQKHLAREYQLLPLYGSSIFGSTKDDKLLYSPEEGLKEAILKKTGVIISRSAPSKLEVGQLQFQGLETVVRSNGIVTLVFGLVWIGIPLVEVKSPSGASGSFPINMSTDGHSPNPNEFKSNALWKFLYAEGAQEQALEIIEDKLSLVRNKSDRTLENTGTCQICTRNVKLDRMQFIVAHGYQNPRYQHGRTQACFGASHKPLELDNDACQSYLKMLNTSRDRTKKALANARNGKFSKPITTRSGKPLEKGSLAYDRMVRGIISGMESDLNYYNHDISEMETRIAGWKPTPLPQT